LADCMTVYYIGAKENGWNSFFFALDSNLLKLYI
jgi:hypothetical protein